MARKTTKRKKSAGTKRAGAARGGMVHWYVLGLAVVGGVLYMDNRLPGPEPAATGIRTASIERKAAKVEREAAVVRPKERPSQAVENALPAEEKLPPFAGKWFICTTQTDYCVLDGSTILYAGRKVRLADIDAPSIMEARCDAERSRGGDAKLRLREILNEGDVTLVAAKGTAGGKDGATPHVILRGGRSIGETLVREGLARPFTGQHRSWCG